MYFDQLLLAARKVHVVYLDQQLGAAHYINFVSNHNTMVGKKPLWGIGGRRIDDRGKEVVNIARLISNSKRFET